MVVAAVWLLIIADSKHDMPGLKPGHARLAHQQYTNWAIRKRKEYRNILGVDSKGERVRAGVKAKFNKSKMWQSHKDTPS